MKSKRNSPCKCGSGIKTKQCCENPALFNEKAKAFREARKARMEKISRNKNSNARDLNKPKLALIGMSTAMLASSY